jgi:hypothetical protein
MLPVVHPTYGIEIVQGALCAPGSSSGFPAWAATVWKPEPEIGDGFRTSNSHPPLHVITLSRMRFTLRHSLLLVLLCGSLSAVSAGTGGEPTALEWLRAVIAAFGGGALSLWIYSGFKARDKTPAPTWAVLPGALMMFALSGLCGYYLEGTSTHLCKHCGATRTTRHFWVCTCSSCGPSHLAELLHYKCLRHDFTMLSEASPLFSGTGNDDIPPVFKQKEELTTKLALLNPVEKCHVLFEQTNKLDREYYNLREIAFNQLGADLFIPESRNMTEAQAVEAWWKRFEPLMQPLKNADDLTRLKRECANEPWVKTVSAEQLDTKN